MILPISSFFGVVSSTRTLPHVPALPPPGWLVTLLYGEISWADTVWVNDRDVPQIPFHTLNLKLLGRHGVGQRLQRFPGVCTFWRQ